MQWGGGPEHRNQTQATGQSFQKILGSVVVDRHAGAIINAVGRLGVHYQAPIVDRSDVFIMCKTGEFTTRDQWESQNWNIMRLGWDKGALEHRWTTATDFKPVPFGSPVWEPVFHPALHGDRLYSPASGGTVLVIDRDSGDVVGRVNPFGEAIDPRIFVTGPLTIDPEGRVVYNAIRLDATSPWGSDALGAWLVRVSPDGSSETVAFDEIVSGAPGPNDPCLTFFTTEQLPWPPSPDAVPPSAPCGSQRPGINVAPAIAADGTIYTASRAHRNDRWSYLVAVNPDLTPKWSASLRDRFHDGCNVLLPANGTPGGCREGSRVGVDPTDNTPGAGAITDVSTASPTVAPDGTILFGTQSRYNYFSGHLVRFSPDGAFLGAYPFGWDLTPSIWEHDGTYSIIIKENHYRIGSYCNSEAFCPQDRTTATPNDPERYLITQLSPELEVEWQYRNTNTESCTRNDDGTVTCVSDRPNGFDWCVNSGVVDARGVFYANSEDGVLYAIGQGGVLLDSIFLERTLGAAYTPVALGRDGLVYAQNDGRLFVIGERIPGKPRPIRRRGGN